MKLLITTFVSTIILATNVKALEVTAGGLANQTGNMTANNVRILTDTHLTVLQQRIVDLQNELDSLNQRMNNMVNNPCPFGQYVHDFNTNNMPVCSTP